MIKQVFGASKIILKGMYNGAAYHIYKKTHVLRPTPRFLIWCVTDNCNSRCQMCNIWKKKAENELTIQEIRNIFQSKLLSELQWINITGGEPFLRKDFMDIIKVLNSKKKLEGIAIPTNGFMTERILKNVEAALKILKKDKFLSVTVSIDGYEVTHDEIRGVKGGFLKAKKTVDELVKLKKKYPNFNVGIQPTISKRNLDEIEEFYKEYKKSYRIGFAVMMQSDGYYSNKDSKIALSKEDKKRVAKLIEKSINDNPEYGFYYKNLAKMLRGGNRGFSCLAGHMSAYMDPKGNLSVCPPLSSNQNYRIRNIRENTKNNDIAYKSWFSTKSFYMRKKLEKENTCRTCTMLCDYINLAKNEFYENFFFLVRNPKIASGLAKKIVREKNPYF